jgi:hypothetical protein
VRKGRPFGVRVLRFDKSTRGGPSDSVRRKFTPGACARPQINSVACEAPSGKPRINELVITRWLRLTRPEERFPQRLLSVNARFTSFSRLVITKALIGELLVQNDFIILAYTGQAPNLAMCRRCDVKFFTPHVPRLDATKAEKYLREKFAAHKCIGGDFSSRYWQSRRAV